MVQIGEGGVPIEPAQAAAGSGIESAILYAASELLNNQEALNSELESTLGSAVEQVSFGQGQSDSQVISELQWSESVLESVNGSAAEDVRDALIGDQWLFDSSLVGGGAAVESVISDAVANGYVMELENAGMQNDSMACSMIQLGFRLAAGTDHPVEETPAPAAGILYTFSQKITLEEGQRLYGRWYGAGAGINLRLLGVGRLKRVP